MYSFPITIGDGAWIGAGAIILPAHPKDRRAGQGILLEGPTLDKQPGD